MPEATLHAELAEELPDLPRWVEARGLLLSRRCEILVPSVHQRTAGYFLIEQDRSLACAIGRPVSSLVQSFLERLEHLPGDYQLLAPLQPAAHLRTLLPGWSESPVTVFVHPEPEALAAGPHRTRLLGGSDLHYLEDVEEPARSELERALPFAPIAAAFDGERPVAFCVCLYETESWWDVELHTLEGYRRSGYATSAAVALVHHMLGLGKKPAWGALESKKAPFGMAVKYGFRAVDRMVVFEPGPGLPADDLRGTS